MSTPPQPSHHAVPVGWRVLFVLALLAALFGLLAPAGLILELKIWVASWLPWAGQIDRSDVLQHADKWVHAAIFLVLGALGMRAWRLADQRRQLVAGLLLMAIGTEWAQHYIPGRSASLGDFAADLAGLLLGALAFTRLLPQAPALRQGLS